MNYGQWFFCLCYVCYLLCKPSWLLSLGQVQIRDKKKKKEGRCHVCVIVYHKALWVIKEHEVKQYGVSVVYVTHNMCPHCRCCTSSWQAWGIRSCVWSAHWSNGTSRDPRRSGKERQWATEKTKKNGSSCPRCFTIWRACRGALFKRYWQPVRIRLCERYCSNYLLRLQRKSTKQAIGTTSTPTVWLAHKAFGSTRV